MESMHWESRPKLRRPALVCSFKGWNDAAESATTALGFVASRWGAERFGAIDPEEFFDFQVTRPTVRLTEGVTRVIEWPELELSSAHPAEGKRDVVFLTGAEPNLRWKTFSATVVDVARELGVDMIVSLGALLADVPHTRPVQITGIAADAELSERLGFTATRYEGPTGHRRRRAGRGHEGGDAGRQPVGAGAALRRHRAEPEGDAGAARPAQELLEVPIDMTDLEEAAVDYERRLDEAVASEPEVRMLVERLERQMDDEEISFRNLPVGRLDRARVRTLSEGAGDEE